MMKRLTCALLLLICTSVLFGCTDSTVAESSDETYDTYTNYYKNILETENKATSCQSFDLSVTVTLLEDGSYKYDVTISNTRVAMYDIMFLAVNDDVGAKVDEDGEVTMPSIGILDETSYAMVPGQVDTANNLVASLTLSLTSENPTMRIGVMVDYLSSDKTDRVRQYLSITGTYGAESTDEESAVEESAGE